MDPILAQAKDKDLLRRVLSKVHGSGAGLPKVTVISQLTIPCPQMASVEAVLTQQQNLSQTSQHQNQLMQQQQEANQTLMNSVLNMLQQLGAAVAVAVAKPKNLVDTRALGKPKDFTGRKRVATVEAEDRVVAQCDEL